MKSSVYVFVGLFVCVVSEHAGAVTLFNNLASYDSAVGAHSVITFQGLGNGTVVTSQFAGLGATFTDGDDTVLVNAAFVTDGVGVDDNGSTTIVFSQPMNHFGVEFPGAATIQLFDGAALVASSAFGGSGPSFFGGILADGQTFDSVVLFDHVDQLGFYDNLHFGNTTPAGGGAVPEPASAALTLIGLASLSIRRQRNRHG